MTDKPPSSLQAVLAHLAETSAVDMSPDAPRAIMDQNIIRVPRSIEFWEMELRDLGRCRAILDAKMDQLVCQYIEPISDKVKAIDSIRLLTADFLDNHVTLSYAGMIQFIQMWETALNRYKIDLPEGIANYRSNIGIQDTPDMEGEITDPNAVDKDLA